MRLRRAVACVAAVAAAATVAAAAAPSTSVAAGTGNATASAMAGGTVGPITPQVQVCPLSLLNILGTCNTGLFGAVNSGLGSLLTPVGSIVSAITAIPSSVVNAVAGAGLTATVPTTQQPRPNPFADSVTSVPNVPTCGSAGWSASGVGDCYSAGGLTVPSNSVLGLNVSGAGGYATDDSTGYVGAAVDTAVSLSALGIPLGGLGAIWSSTTCSNDSTKPNCVASNSTVQAGLLPTTAFPQGALKVTIANNSAPSVLSLNGAVLSATNNTVPLLGLGTATVSITNKLLTLSIALSTSAITSLIPALSGLTSLVSATGTLTLVIGPGTTSTTATTATSSGLTIGADLALDVKLSVLGLATVDVSSGGAMSTPDLLNLTLGNSSATAGSPLASWIGSGAI